MEKLWHVQRLKDGTYGDWEEFKENKEGIIFTKGKIYKYKTEEKMKILILEGLYGNNKGKKMQWRLKRTNLKLGDKVVLNCKDWKIIKVIKEKKRSVFPKGAIFSEYSTMNFNDMCEKEHLKMFKKLVNDPLIKKIIKKCHKFANIGKEV